MLPPTSVARIATTTGTPAVTGEVMVPITKWSAPLGSTEIPALVMDWIEPLVWSVTVRVWVPTVRNVSEKPRLPFESVPLAGVNCGSLEVTRTASPDGSGFHQVSVE